tara:strand:- start:1547 stop:2425 length:879 start_codon:yes stop_codon:yes gene_type:complete
VIKVGIIGLHNKDNGHPFSFSAIINGYNKKNFKSSPYKVILDYLEKRKKNEFGIRGVKITHAWTQNSKLTKILCKSCNIKYPLKNYEDMLDEIDAVIIARDNFHYKIAKKFLKKGIPTFIDKPLSLNKKELKKFSPYLKSAKLMSSSGLRYSPEVFKLKKSIKKLGKIVSVNANVINNLENYGVHMLDIIDELNLLKVKKIFRIKQKNIDTVNIVCKNKSTINLNCLGRVKKIFNLKIIGKNGFLEENFLDNFSSFKNTLITFFKMVKSKKVQLDPKRTLKIMNLIISVKKL